MLTIEEVSINDNCVGYRWTVTNFDSLARTIAIIAMGQASHAAQIIKQTSPVAPAINHESLRQDAKQSLSISCKTQNKVDTSRYHRDGLIFEAISWLAAKQATNGKALLRDPHIKSTTQGLDGLMIELDATHAEIHCATIFEDKCSGDPRRVFRDEIKPTFLAYHRGLRSNELLSSAAALLEKAGMSGNNVVEAAARVLDKNYRAYRASLATTPENDSQEQRKHIFKDYDELVGITANQRMGGVLVTAEGFRTWFDELAERAIEYIDSLESEESDV